MGVSPRAPLRRLLGVVRTPTYYLPWVSGAELECGLVLSNVESRFSRDFGRGPLTLTITQYDAGGRIARSYEVFLADSAETVELRLESVPGGCGFAVVEGAFHSDLYATVSDGTTYAATHGRGEFLETYPRPARWAHAALGWLLGLFGRTLPAFARDQYVYVGRDHRSNLLLLNLANITNRVRVIARPLADPRGRPVASRLIALPPRGAHLLDVGDLVTTHGSMVVSRFRLEANAWFNLYVVGVGANGLAGPLSLMHVK